MRGDVFHNRTEIIQWLHFSHHSSGEWKDDNFMTHTHTHWWHECNFFREMTSWQKYIPDKFLRCIFSCPYSGSQLTGVTWVVDRANVMWASVSVERALDLETAHEVKFYLGLLSALLLGLLTSSLTFCVLSLKWEWYHKLFSFPRASDEVMNVKQSL